MMNDIIPYTLLFVLISMSLGWLVFSDKIRTWLNAKIS